MTAGSARFIVVSACIRRSYQRVAAVQPRDTSARTERCQSPLRIHDRCMRNKGRNQSEVELCGKERSCCGAAPWPPPGTVAMLARHAARETDMTIASQDGIPTLATEPPSLGAAVSPAEVRAMLHDGGEIALLDVREEGVFSEQGHPFFANSVPLSRLELMIRDLVPRRGTRVVVLDGGDDYLAERAAAKLDRMGYDNVAVMA